jgi:ATP-dependent RNA/DNA helicase IGHMBP2
LPALSAMEKHRLHNLLELVEIERAADLETYRQLIEQLPLSERKEKGVTWHPVEVTKSGYTYGERAYVIVQRSTADQRAHQFRSGKTVRFYAQQPDTKVREKTGVIQFVDKNRMKIVLNSKDLPDWLNLGDMGVDLLFDDRPYVEMKKALDQVISAQRDRLAELRDIFLGKQPPARYPELPEFNHPDLNPSQQEAIRHILASRDATVVHGPPGTGKTTTLVQAVKELAQREHTVLVCAPSNTAVDLLTERLAAINLNVVRVGNISRVDESIVRHTLEARISDHPESKNIKKVKIQAAETRRQAKRYRRKFGREEHLERRNLFREAGELEAWANQLEDRLIDNILSGAQVVTCTLVGAANKVLKGRKFRTVVIDEAAQALEPATWIPMLKASKVVLAGDPFQLPPTVKSIEAQRGGLEKTLIEQGLGLFPQVHLLNIQYRMHTAIMGFSNQQFYEGKLQAAEQVAFHQLSHGSDAPVAFIDTAGCGFEEQINPEYKSRFNPEEFHILQEHLLQLIESHESVALPSIALISPYREQVMHMENILRQESHFSEVPIAINTIDGFQGQERDVVYISLVRSNGKGEIGFLKDYRRMNVAMTRARKLLVVIGDSATIGGYPFYQEFLEYVEREGSYRTAWEYMQGS